LFDIDKLQLEKAINNIQQNLERQAKKGLLNRAWWL